MTYDEAYLVGLRRWVGGAVIGTIRQEYEERGLEMEPIPQTWREKRAGRD